MGTWTSEGGAIAEYAGFDNFPAGSDGLVIKDSNSGFLFQYNAVAGLWLPTAIQPAAILKSLDGSDLPENQDGDFSSVGTEAVTSDGSKINIDDDASGSYRLYGFTDAVNIVDSKNICAILRARVNSENTTASGYKAMLGIKPSTGKAPALSFAGGADGIGGAAQMYPFGMGAGASLTSTPTYSPDNSVYQHYFIATFATEKKAIMGALYDPRAWYGLDIARFDANYLTNSSIHFGTYSSAAQCNFDFDLFKAFNF